jgi:hypothetical protein
MEQKQHHQIHQMGEKTCTLRKAERSANLSAGGGSEGDRRCRRAQALVARVGSSGGADLQAVQAHVGSSGGAGARGLRWRCRRAWAPVVARTSRRCRHAWRRGPPGRRAWWRGPPVARVAARTSGGARGGEDLRWRAWAERGS